MEHHEHIKHTIDWFSLGGFLATLAGLLPQATMLLTFIWTIGRLIEMFTGKPIHELIKRKV